MNEEMMKRSKEGGEGRGKDEHMEEITFENLMTFIPALPISSVRISKKFIKGTQHLRTRDTSSL